MSTNKQNWSIYRESSGTASILARVYVLLLSLFLLLFLQVNILYYSVLFAIFDVLQYATHSISYNILARLQELGYIKKNNRPGYFNWTGKLFWYSKLGVCIYMLYLVL